MNQVETLHNRILKSGIWNGLGTLSEQSFRFISNMLIARILIPEILAEVSIVLSIVMFFESMSQFGIKEAVIQDPDNATDSFLDMAFYFAIIRGILIFIIGSISAPMISGFYNNNKMTALIRITFTGIIFNSLLSINVYKLYKDFQFHKIILIENLGRILGITTTIFLVWKYKTSYAMAIGIASENGYRLILSYIVAPHIPKINSNKKEFTKLLNFSKGMLGLPILTTIVLRADIFVLGKMVAPYWVGLYSMAVILARAPLNSLLKLCRPILLPYFSKIQKDINKIEEGFINITNLFCVITFPAFIFVLFFGSNLLSIIFTTEYSKISISFTLIFAAYIVRTFSIPVASIYMALGKPQLHRRFALLRVILIAAIIVPLIHFFGTVGAAVAFLITNIISYMFQLFDLNKRLEFNNLKIIKVIVKSIIFVTPVIISKQISSFMQLENILLAGIIGVLFSYILSIKKLRQLIKKDK